MSRKTLAALLAFAGLLLGTACSSKEELRKVEREVGDLKIEVFKLRREMEDANRQAQAETTAAEQGRTLDRRFQADLQESLRQLQDSTRILNNRLADPNRPVAAAARAATSAAPQAGQPVQPAQAEDEKALAAAVLDYNRGNYALSADSLDLFLKGYPQSAKRPDALFFLGLANYNQKLYDKAKPAFEQIIKSHTTSAQYLPALLKRGQCLLKMGLKPAAVRAFREIVDGFPGTPEARTAQQELSDLGL